MLSSRHRLYDFFSVEEDYSHVIARAQAKADVQIAKYEQQGYKIINVSEMVEHPARYLLFTMYKPLESDPDAP